MEEHETPEAEEVISIQPTCADGLLAAAAGMFQHVTMNHDVPQGVQAGKLVYNWWFLVFVLVILTNIN